MTSPTGTFVDNQETRERLEQLELIAHWMDRRFLDPLLGMFLPGGGSTISSLVGLYGVFLAARLNVHPATLGRMLVHLAIDAFISSVPFLGWFGDFLYRAHLKNYHLVLERGEGGDATTGDWLYVASAGGLFLFALAAPVLIVLGLLIWATAIVL